MSVGKQSVLNDLLEIDKKVNSANSGSISAINKAEAAVSIARENANSSMYRGFIETEDFFIVRETGVYKVQNGTGNLNKNSPSSRTSIYGTLCVFRAETDGENRLCMEYTSYDGVERFFTSYNDGWWRNWVMYYTSKNTIKDSNGFIKAS